MTALSKEHLQALIDYAQGKFDHSDTADKQAYEYQYTSQYTDDDGNFIYAKPRFKNITAGKKWIRVFSLDGGGKWQMKEPDFKSAYRAGKGKKPLYLLPTLTNKATADDPIYIFEGEQKADLAHRLGLIATTSGSSGSIKKHNWQPIAGREVVLWCDNDKSGYQWLEVLASELSNIGCHVSIIDTAGLNLNAKDDIVDWANRMYADGEDDLGILQAIKNLPTLTDEQVSALSHSTSTVSITHKPQGELLEPPFDYENGKFELYQNGLFFVTYDDDGQVKYASRICSSLQVLGRSHDTNGDNWGIVLKWTDRANNPHQWAMPIHCLQGDSREYRKALANQGLIISTAVKAQKYLDAYLNHHPTTNKLLSVNKLGWYEQTFVLPKQVIGKNTKSVVYQPEQPISQGFSQQGTLAQWRDEVCKPMAEQSRIAFAISCAFAGQLLEPLGYESGGFHIVGNSSTGKSTGLMVAGSVWGNPADYVRKWNSTKNGLEGIATMHNDGFLGLDEISEMNPHEIGNAVYMLADGRGKERSTPTGLNRPVNTWRTLFLSNGEETLTSYMQRANKKTNAGMLARLCHIDNDVGNGFGGFDSLVIADTAESQANQLKQRCKRYYGVAGMAWLEYLTNNLDNVTQQAQTIIATFMADYDDLKEQANRVAKRFALVATAGELATQAGITGWQAGQATKAVKSCLDNWVSNNGKHGNHEQVQILSHIKAYIEKNGGSKFEDFAKNDCFNAERVGLHDKVNNRYLFFTNVFPEICQPYSKKQVISILDLHKLLTKAGNDRYTNKVAFNGGRINVYDVKGEILFYEIEE